MNSRIKQIRKSLDLTQQEFADRLGIKRNTVATYEVGKSNPSDAAISLICREFNVNENWLRTGKGNMFKPEVTNAFDAFVKERGINSNERILIEKFLSLKPEGRQAVIGYLLDVAAAISGSAKSTDNSGVAYIPEMPIDEYSFAADVDIEAEVAKYRADLERQKKAMDNTSASNGTGGAGA